MKVGEKTGRLPLQVVSGTLVLLPQIHSLPSRGQHRGMAPSTEIWNLTWAQLLTPLTASWVTADNDLTPSLGSPTIKSRICNAYS